MVRDKGKLGQTLSDHGHLARCPKLELVRAGPIVEDGRNLVRADNGAVLPNAEANSRQVREG